MRFAIDGGGNVISTGLVRSSGHADLDQAVLALVRRTSPVPAPPPAPRTRSPRRCASRSADASTGPLISPAGRLGSAR